MTGPRHADRPSHVARFTSASTSEGSALNPDTLEVAPGTIHESVQGWVPKLATEEELRIALEKAFDYRGDVKKSCASLWKKLSIIAVMSL